MLAILLMLALVVLAASWFIKAKSVNQRAFALMVFGLMLLPIVGMAQSTNVTQLIEETTDTWNSVFGLMIIVTVGILGIRFARKIR